MGADENEDYFRTSDMALATVISLFHAVEEVDRQNPRRAEFMFRQSAGLNRLVEDYWKGVLRIEPQQFFNQLRLIKARLYGDERP